MEAYSVGTLRNWRAMRIGPTFVKIGKAVLYPTTELDAWDQKNMVTCRASRRLTVDAGEKRDDHARSMQNRSQLPSPHRSRTQIFSFDFNSVGKIDGVVHNHPSGDPEPSTEDIYLTHQIIAVGKSLKIAVHDHLIIGKHGHASLKGLRLI